MVRLLFLTNDDYSSSNSKLSAFFAISFNRVLFSNRNFDIVEVFCNGARVLVDALVKKVRQEGGSSTAKSIKELNGRRKTFVAILKKSEESKSGPVGANSVNKHNGGRKETFVTALGPTPQIAPRPPMLSLPLPNASRNTLSRSIEEPGSGEKTCTAALAKNDKGNGRFEAS